MPKLSLLYKSQDKNKEKPLLHSMDDNISCSIEWLYDGGLLLAEVGLWALPNSTIVTRVDVEV